MSTLTRDGAERAICLRARPAMMCGDVMIRITLFYLYRLATHLRPLTGLQERTKLSDAWITLYQAESALTELQNDPVLTPSLRTSVQSLNALLLALKKLTTETDRERELDFMDIYSIQGALTQFETVFGAELEVADAYIVSKKRGYDTSDLITQAEVLFPPELIEKVPATMLDVREAGRCMAFELPTAAGFHLHRATESVLRQYYEVVTNGAPRPKSRNIGNYLNKMDKLGVGDKKVKSALKDLKDLHRNPLIHPDDSLESIDEVIALLGSIHAVVVHMLKEIPWPPEIL